MIFINYVILETWVRTMGLKNNQSPFQNCQGTIATVQVKPILSLAQASSQLSTGHAFHLGVVWFPGNCYYSSTCKERNNKNNKFYIIIVPCTAFPMDSWSLILTNIGHDKYYTAGTQS